MKIRLNEIPEHGENFSFNRQGAELNADLDDLLSGRTYSADFFLKPLNGRDYTLNGKLSAAVPAECSRCGIDFDVQIKSNLNEILIPKGEEDRTGKYAKSNVKIDGDNEGISVTEYAKMQFDVGEYLHEAIALEVPFIPRCQECAKLPEDSTFIYDEKMSEEAKPNPFQALKGLKLN